LEKPAAEWPASAPPNPKLPPDEEMPPVELSLLELHALTRTARVTVAVKSALSGRKEVFMGICAPGVGEAWIEAPETSVPESGADQAFK
jgi:hypothetical protein